MGPKLTSGGSEGSLPAPLNHHRRSLEDGAVTHDGTAAPQLLSEVSKGRICSVTANHACVGLSCSGLPGRGVDVR